ncbi:hypothetical protein [Microbispora sp. KK1-11]|nr:hypothetical protein [Microbispora sp. KK1-11]
MTNPMPPEPAHGAGPTEDDEEAILRSLYGEPDSDGIYRGEPVGGDQ